MAVHPLEAASMPPRLAYQIELRRLAMQLALQLPHDPAEARLILRYLQELVSWLAEPPERL